MIKYPGFYKTIDEVLQVTGCRKYRYTPEGYIIVVKDSKHWLIFRHFESVMGWAQINNKMDRFPLGRRAYSEKAPRSRVCFSRKLKVRG